jgi:hypothetical protein
LASGGTSTVAFIKTHVWLYFLMKDGKALVPAQFIEHGVAQDRVHSRLVAAPFGLEPSQDIGFNSGGLIFALELNR